MIWKEKGLTATASVFNAALVQSVRKKDSYPFQFLLLVISQTAKKVCLLCITHNLQ